MYHYTGIYNKHNDVIFLLSMLYNKGRIFQKHSVFSCFCQKIYPFQYLFEESTPIL